MPLPDFNALIERAKHGRCLTVAVARAEERSVLEGLAAAAREGIAKPILFGEADRTQLALDELGLGPWPIVHVSGGDRQVAQAAVRAVASGDADVLMKGLIATKDLLGAVLNRSNGLIGEGVLSHMALIETPRYHKVFGLTDGGLNVRPDFFRKTAIARNIAEVFRALGYDRPKIALLSYIEKPDEQDLEIADWLRLLELAQAGGLGEAIVEGPLALDLCLSEEAARIKGVRGEVVADADAIVAPDITVCNATTKAFAYMGAALAGGVVGARAPIVSLSRADTPRSRLCSLALASVLADAKRSRPQRQN